MKFEMKKEVSFIISLHDNELKALHTLLQKVNSWEGHEVTGYKVSEFNITDGEIDLAYRLSNHITESEAYKELKLNELEVEL
jgi:hypothetical protein